MRIRIAHLPGDARVRVRAVDHRDDEVGLVQGRNQPVEETEDRRRVARGAVVALRLRYKDPEMLRADQGRELIVERAFGRREERGREVDTGTGRTRPRRRWGVPGNLAEPAPAPGAAGFVVEVPRHAAAWRRVDTDDAERCSPLGHDGPDACLELIEESGKDRRVKPPCERSGPARGAEVDGLGAGERHDLDPELAAPLERPGVDRAVRVRCDPLGPERRVEQAGGGEHVH